MSRRNYLEAFYDEETGCYEYLPHRRRGNASVVTDWDDIEGWALPKGLAGSAATADLGFHFTEDELAAIERAEASAAVYMRGYGRGREPMDIDTRHYYTALPRQTINGQTE